MFKFLFRLLVVGIIVVAGAWGAARAGIIDLPYNPGASSPSVLATEGVPDVGNAKEIDSPLQIFFDKHFDAAYLILEGAGSRISGVPAAVSVTARDHAGGVRTVVLPWEDSGSKFVGFSSPHGLLGLTLADATPFGASQFSTQATAALTK